MFLNLFRNTTYMCKGANLKCVKCFINKILVEVVDDREEKSCFVAYNKSIGFAILYLGSSRCTTNLDKRIN